MNVRVKLFAVAKELSGCDELTIDLQSGARVVDVKHAIAAKYPALERIAASSVWAVDAAYANEDTPVNENSEVALIPPVSGG